MPLREKNWYPDSFYLRIDRPRPHSLVPDLRCYMSNQHVGGASSATTTQTTSGASSPVASGSSLAVGSGSIGVSGQGAKYIEQGGADNSNANQSTNINAGGGATVTIGDPNADQTISQLAQTFAQAVQSTAADAASGVQAAVSSAGTSGTISLKTLGIGVAILAAIIGLFTLLGGKSKI